MGTSFFDKLLDIEMPRIQKGKPVSPGTIAAGPFAVVHNEIRGLGAYLHQYLDVVAFLDSSVYRTLTQDYAYTLDQETDSITFYYEEMESKFTIEPVIEEDMATFYPEKTFADLDEFLAFLEKLAQQITFGPHIELSDFSITVDEDTSRVLGLFKREDENFYRREQAGWTRITASDEDWDDIEGYSWESVLSGAVSVFDDLETADTIDRNTFEAYIVS